MIIDVIKNMLLVVFEIICLKTFLEIFCVIPERRNARDGILFVVALIVASTVLSMIDYSYFPIKAILVVMVFSIASQIYYDIRIIRACILSVLYYGLLIAVDYATIAVIQAMFGQYYLLDGQYAASAEIIVIMGKVLVFAIVLMLGRIVGNNTVDMLSDSEWVRLLAFPIFTVLVFCAMGIGFRDVKDQGHINIILMVAIGMVALNIFVYYLIRDIVRREVRLHETEAIGIQAKNQISMYNSLFDSLQQQRSRVHDFNSHIICIKRLAESENYDKMKEYISKLEDNAYLINEAIDTNNMVVNIILNDRYSFATKNEILFVFKVNDLSNIEIEDDDLVVLLSNLLSNAIEACERCKGKREIRLKFIEEKSGIILSVSNTYDGVIYHDGEDMIRTSKSNNMNEHGIGLKNIIQIVEKYKGTYTIDQVDHVFSFSIIFPN